jgi:hypothetical protein
MTPATGGNRREMRLESVLAILSARFTDPALILVTAATREDDTGLLAASLARSVQALGKRCALLSLAGSALTSGEKTAGPYTVIRPSAGTLASPAAFEQAATMWRQRYDFSFVDAPAFLKSPLAPYVARSACGVLIAMRRGRQASASDRDTAGILKNLGASIVGVVFTPARKPASLGPFVASVDHALTDIADAELRARPAES